MADIDKEVDRIVANKDFENLAGDLETAAKGMRQADVSVLKELRGHLQAALYTCDFIIKAFEGRK